MKKILLSCEEAKEKYNLTDLNHVLSSPKGVLDKIYGIELLEDVRLDIPGVGIKVNIGSWKTDYFTNKSCVEIIAHDDNGTIYWEPFIEYLNRKQFLNIGSGKDIYNYRFGYVDGRKWHSGTIYDCPEDNDSENYYIMWQEYTLKSKNQ